MPILDISAVRQGHRRFLRANERLVARVADNAAKEAILQQDKAAKFKHRTGAARAGARAKLIRLKSGRRVRVYNVAKHAGYLELGTRPHTITARRARVLSFVVGGRRLFRRSVRHPGTKPYRFIRTSAALAGRRAERELRAGMKQIASQF